MLSITLMVTLCVEGSPQISVINTEYVVVTVGDSVGTGLSTSLTPSAGDHK